MLDNSTVYLEIGAGLPWALHCRDKSDCLRRVYVLDELSLANFGAFSPTGSAQKNNETTIHLLQLLTSLLN